MRKADYKAFGKRTTKPFYSVASMPLSARAFVTEITAFKRADFHFASISRLVLTIRKTPFNWFPYDNYIARLNTSQNYVKPC